MWSARGNAAANKSINKTATIKAPMEVLWWAVVGSSDGGHGRQPPLVISALASIRSVEGGSACLKTFRINLVLVGEIKRRIGHFEL